MLNRWRAFEDVHSAPSRAAINVPECTPRKPNGCKCAAHIGTESLQATAKASREPVAGLNHRERATDCLWEAAISVVVCSEYINLYSEAMASVRSGPVLLAC